MASESTTAAIPSGIREHHATRAAFFSTGLIMAAWAPLVPLVKARLDLDDAKLGTLLLCLGLGSVIAMPLSGGWAAKFGCRWPIYLALTLSAIALPLVAFAPSSLALAIGLLATGAGIGTADVVMNIQATIVERESGRAMMSGFHGFYSVGGIVGAGIVTVLLTGGLSALASAAVISGMVVLLMTVSIPGLLTHGGASGGAVFAWPRGRVLLLGAMCFAMFLAEGSVLDWSGVLLTDLRGMDAVHAGWGYVAFACTMTVGRFTGDRLVTRFGPLRIATAGAACAALGYVIAATIPNGFAALAGFALVGLGASNVVPVLFSAAGRQSVMPGNLALASITTMGYAGILLGPALVGFVSRASSLTLGLLVVAGMLAAVSLSARRALTEA